MPERSPPDNACLNLAWCQSLLLGLRQGGVEQLVLSPGSRSTPVVQAAERCPGLHLHDVLDERAAAFLALGLARAGGRPVGLLATSGSAPAHWHPAVVEADAWGVPLVLISADRPPELRGWGANQTTDQQHLFARHARAFHDPGTPRPGRPAMDFIQALGRRAAIESRWPRRGPVQINLPLREPLVAGADCQTPPAEPTPTHWRAPEQRLAREPLQSLRARLDAGNGLILCGPGDYPPEFADAVGALARRLGVPLLADPLSGLRGQTGAADVLICRYDSFLRQPGLARRLRPDWALCFGREPVSKTLLQQLGDCEHILVDPEGRWADSQHRAHSVLPAEPLELCRDLREQIPETPGTEAGRWLTDWRAAERDTEALAGGFLARAPWFEGQMLQQLLDLRPRDTPLLLGNSLPVRHFDTWSGAHPNAGDLFGNRGVSGIDGQVATLAGIAAQRGRAIGLIGDLSLLHDLGGLQLTRGRELVLLVINNGGGGIFDYLPQHQLAGFETHWRCPQSVPLAHAAGLFGLGFAQARSAASLEQALQDALRRGGPHLIEILIDPLRSHALTRQWWQDMSDANFEINAH